MSGFSLLNIRKALAESSGASEMVHSLLRIYETKNQKQHLPLVEKEEKIC